MAMTKRDLVLDVAEKLGFVQVDVQQVVQGVFNVISNALSDGKRLELRGFGVFEVKTRKSRPARNPRTGAGVQLPNRRVVTFKPGKKMKGLIEKGKAPEK